MTFQLYVQWHFNGTFDKATRLVFVRDDLPSATLDFEMERDTGPQVRLDGSRRYTAHWIGTVPSSFKMEAPGLDK